MPLDVPNIRLRAVGVGRPAIAVLRSLSRDIPGLICHEVEGFGMDGVLALETLRAVLPQTDLLYLLLAPDSSTERRIAVELCRVAHVAGVLTLTMIGNHADASLQQLEGFADLLFPLSSNREVTRSGASPATDCAAMHQIVVTTGRLLMQETLVGIDFVDVAKVLRTGTYGWLGVGIAAGEACGERAARLSLGQLAGAGMDVKAATGLLGIIELPPSASMELFDQVCRVLHESAATDAAVLAGMIYGRPERGDVTVSILAATSAITNQFCNHACRNPVIASHHE